MHLGDASARAWRPARAASARLRQPRPVRRCRSAPERYDVAVSTSAAAAVARASASAAILAVRERVAPTAAEARTRSVSSMRPLSPSRTDVPCGRGEHRRRGGRAGVAPGVALPDRHHAVDPAARGPATRPSRSTPTAPSGAASGPPRGPRPCGCGPRPRGEVHATAWGPGADWVLDQLPAMLGADDDPTGFAPHPPGARRRLHRRHPHWRVCRTGLVMEALVPAIIEQKVTGQEAFGGFRRLVRRFGERAPGAGRRPRALWVQPSRGDAADDPVVGVAAAARRPGAVARRGRGAAQVAPSLERTAGLPADEVDRRLRVAARASGSGRAPRSASGRTATPTR